MSFADALEMDEVTKCEKLSLTMVEVRAVKWNLLEGVENVICLGIWAIDVCF